MIICALIISPAYFYAEGYIDFAFCPFICMYIFLFALPQRSGYLFQSSSSLKIWDVILSRPVNGFGLCFAVCYSSSQILLAHLSRRLKVRYCDHSPSVVVVVVRPSVRPFTIFKQHLLLNHWLDFDQISQEWSLVDPLSKLFKWFRSIAYLGHRS